jgi:hypothetical protein
MSGDAWTNSSELQEAILVKFPLQEIGQLYVVKRSIPSEALDSTVNTLTLLLLLRLLIIINFDFRSFETVIQSKN